MRFWRWLQDHGFKSDQEGTGTARRRCYRGLKVVVEMSEDDEIPF